MAKSWLQLSRLHGLGPAGIVKLLAFFDKPENALQASYQDWLRAGLSNKQARAIEQSLPDVSADLEWLNETDNHLVTLHDSNYPPLLKDIPSPPPILYVKGDPELLKHPQLAMVGSRNPTRSGIQTAQAFARYFARAGLAITSGMALGIDAASHKGALDADGLTIAVAGTGLDRIYPARHRALAKEIADKGALVSEFPIGTHPQAENFPRRNRIISGLSLGILVVEAAQKSGSLISARYANEQGREVFAIPGSIHNPLARGCHQLIKEGAKLVETAEDVLEELAPLLSSVLNSPIDKPAETEKDTPLMDKDQRTLLAAIDFEPTAIDSIIQRSGLTAESVSSMLLIMELNNFIASEPGGYYLRLQGD